jgi:hypothetical protein
MINFNAVVSLIIGLFTLGVLIYIIPIQGRESLRPFDQLTKLRWIIFILLVLSAYTIVFPLMYQFLRATGSDSEAFRNIASISSRVSQFGTAILLLMVFKYKVKDK